MYYVGIDISKYKHDCFILDQSGEIIVNDFVSFTDNTLIIHFNGKQISISIYPSSLIFRYISNIGLLSS